MPALFLQALCFVASAMYTFPTPWFFTPKAYLDTDEEMKHRLHFKMVMLVTSIALLLLGWQSHAHRAVKYLVDAGLLNVDNLYALNHPRTGEQGRSRLRWAEDAWMGVGGCGCAE